VGCRKANSHLHVNKNYESFRSGAHSGDVARRPRRRPRRDNAHGRRDDARDPRRYCTATPGAPAKHPDKQGRCSEQGWGRSGSEDEERSLRRDERRAGWRCGVRLGRHRDEADCPSLPSECPSPFRHTSAIVSLLLPQTQRLIDLDLFFPNPLLPCPDIWPPQLVHSHAHLLV